MRRLLAILLATVSIVGCSEAPQEMPAIPNPDLSQTEQMVASVLYEARQDLLAEKDSAEAWGRLGGAYHAHAMYDEAEACYRAARILSPTDFRWPYLLAVERVEAGGEPKETLALFNEAARVRREYAPLSVRVGQILLHHGRPELARKSFARAAKMEPQLAVAQLGMALAFFAEENGQLARIALERARELTPDDGAVHAALARVLTVEGRTDEARRAAARARRLSQRTTIPDPIVEEGVHALGASSVHWVLRARQRIARGEFAEALIDLQPPRGRRPGDADLLHLKGLAHRGLGEPRDAEEAFARAVVGTPDHVPSHIELGRLLLGDDAEVALSHLRHARTLAPADPELLSVLTSALARAGALDEAIDACEMLAVVLPEDPRVRLNLGTLLVRRGDLQRAESELRLAVELDPDYSEAHLRLAVLLEHLGRTEEARGHREAAGES